MSNMLIKIFVIAVGMNSLIFASQGSSKYSLQLSTIVVSSQEQLAVSVEQARQMLKRERTRQKDLPKSQRDSSKVNELRQDLSRSIAMQKWASLKEELVIEDDPEQVKNMLTQASKIFEGVDRVLRTRSKDNNKRKRRKQT